MDTVETTKFQRGDKYITFSVDYVYSCLFTIETNMPELKYMEMRTWSREDKDIEKKFNKNYVEFERKYNAKKEWTRIETEENAIY